MRPSRTLAVAFVALALAAPLVLADAASDLDHAVKKHDAEAAKQALAAATQAGDVKAATTILRFALDLAPLDCHQELLKAIAGIKDDAGVKKLAGSAKNDPSVDMRFLLVEGLARQGSADAARAVLDALDSDKSDQVLVAAARNARHLDPQLAFERLIARLEKAERNPHEATLTREINGTLGSLSGEALTFALEWTGWWKQHRDSIKGGAPPPPAADSPKSDTPPKGDDTPAPPPRAREPEPPPPSGGDTSVTGRMTRERPADQRAIDKLTADDVICIGGIRDHVESVLDAIHVKHSFFKKDDFDKAKLDPKAVLVVNCDGPGRPKFSDDQITKIRDFVERGGYLFTSDWEIKSTIERAFPGSIAKAGVSSENKEGPGFKADILPAREASNHPFLRDVFAATTWDSGKLSWQIDEMCFLIKVISPDVKVLIESEELRKRFPGTPAVAVTFAWSGGKVATPRQGTATGPGSDKARRERVSGGCVLHVLSHFEHQKDKDSGDKFALQQLLLNFFLEKQAARKGQ